MKTGRNSDFFWSRGRAKSVARWGKSPRKRNKESMKAGIIPKHPITTVQLHRNIRLR
jgi:hypothetical protein